LKKCRKCRRWSEYDAKECKHCYSRLFLQNQPTKLIAKTRPRTRFAEFIQQERIKQGITAMDLETLTGIGRTTLEAIQRGTSIPGLSLVIRIARVIKMDLNTLDQFFDYHGRPYPSDSELDYEPPLSTARRKMLKDKGHD
jgi:transcriptional regulator with XRE-family HTH domain